MKIITISGYGRSGKSTFLNYCRAKLLVCISTSEYLNTLLCDHFQLDKDYWKPILINKSKKYLCEFKKLTNYPTYAEAKSDLAENILECQQSIDNRFNKLILPTLIDSLPILFKYSEDLPILLEVGNLEEFLLFYRALKSVFKDTKYEIYNYQLIRQMQEKRSDYRKPFGVKLKDKTVEEIYNKIASDCRINI